MSVEQLKNLTQELERILESLRKQTDPFIRKQIFNDFKILYQRIKKELI